MKRIFIILGLPGANEDEFKFLCKPFKRDHEISVWRHQTRRYY